MVSSSAAFAQVLEEHTAEVIKDRISSWEKEAFLWGNGRNVEVGDHPAINKIIYHKNLTTHKMWFMHDCGSRGGVYNITRSGKCYKCRAQLPNWKILEVSLELHKMKEETQIPTTNLNYTQWPIPRGNE